jgi:hypothetical protein
MQTAVNGSGIVATENTKMNGTVTQVKQAELIKVRINAEFDRIAKALETSAAKQSGQDRMDTEAVILILEDKRAEVMSKGQADYFINNWRELSFHVREMIVRDSRYLAIHSKKALRRR